MKVVVFTCSTGGGHNACARYIKKEFDDYGISCDVQDYLKLVGDNAAKIIDHFILDRTDSWQRTRTYAGYNDSITTARP